MPGKVVPLFPEDSDDMDTASLLAEGFMLLRNLPPGDYLSRTVRDLRAIAADPRVAGALSAGALTLRGDAPHDQQQRLTGSLIG
jgi:hypothetical protein